MNSLSLFIPCVPPTATSQQKGAFAMPGGGIRFFKKKNVQRAENTWFALLQPHRPERPFEGPLTLVLSLYYPWRKSELKRVRSAYRIAPIATRPDVENIAKATIDVMTTLGFWHDDGQISSLCLHKAYSDEPGIAVNLTHSLATTHEGQQSNFV